MGYTTEFRGKWKVTPTLLPEHAAYIKQFSETRRMKRDAAKAEARPDPVRMAVGLPIGPEGAFFVGEGGFAGQGDWPRNKGMTDILDYNGPPIGQPGLWCQWVPSPDGGAIEWDGGEKFYCYQEWIRYLLSNFLQPWGYKLNGKIRWQGEDMDDKGTITIEDNIVDGELIP